MDVSESDTQIVETKPEENTYTKYTTDLFHDNGPTYFLENYSQYLGQKISEATHSKQSIHIKSQKVNELLSKDKDLYKALQIDTGDTSLLISKVIYRIIRDTNYSLKDIFKFLRHHAAINLEDWIFYYYQAREKLAHEKLSLDQELYDIHKNIEEFRRSQEEKRLKKQTADRDINEPKKRGKKKTLESVLSSTADGQSMDLMKSEQSYPSVVNYSDDIAKPISLNRDITHLLFTNEYLRFFNDKYNDWLTGENRQRIDVKKQENKIINNIKRLSKVPVEDINVLGYNDKTKNVIEYSELTYVFNPKIVSGNNNLNEILGEFLDFFNCIEVSEVLQYVQYNSLDNSYYKIFKDSITEKEVERIIPASKRGSTLHMHFILKISESEKIDKRYQLVQYNLSQDKNQLKFNAKQSIAQTIEVLVKSVIFDLANLIYKQFYFEKDDDEYLEDGSDRYILGQGRQTKISGNFILSNVYYTEPSFLDQILNNHLLRSFLFLKEGRSCSKDVTQKQTAEASKKKASINIYFNLFKNIEIDRLVKMVRFHVEKTVNENIDAVKIMFNDTELNDLIIFTLFVRDIFAYYQYSVNNKISSVIPKSVAASMQDNTVDELYEMIDVKELETLDIQTTRQNLPKGISAKKKEGEIDSLIKMMVAFAPHVFPVSIYGRYGATQGSGLDQWSKFPRIIMDDDEYPQFQKKMNYNDLAMQKAIDNYNIIYEGHITDQRRDSDGNLIEGSFIVPWSSERQRREIIYFPKLDRPSDELTAEPSVRLVSLGRDRPCVGIRENKYSHLTNDPGDHKFWFPTCVGDKNKDCRTTASASKYKTYLSGGTVTVPKTGGKSGKSGYIPTGIQILEAGNYSNLPNESFAEFLQSPYASINNNYNMRRLSVQGGENSIFHAILTAAPVSTYYRDLYGKLPEDWRNLYAADYLREEEVENKYREYSNLTTKEIGIDMNNKRELLAAGVKNKVVEFVTGNLYRINQNDMDMIVDTVNKFNLDDKTKDKLITYIRNGTQMDNEFRIEIESYISNDYKAEEDEVKVVAFILDIIRGKRINTRLSMVSQEMYNYSHDKITEYMEHFPFNTNLLYRAIEEFFNINLFVFNFDKNDKVNLDRHPYKVFQSRIYRPNRHTLLVSRIVKSGISKYDLIVNHGNNVNVTYFGSEMASLIHNAFLETKTTMSFTFSPDGQTTIRENIYSYVNKQNNQAFDYRSIFPVDDFYIHGQYVDKYGKLRLLAIEYMPKRLKFLIETFPSQPLGVLDFNYEQLSNSESEEYKFIIDHTRLNEIFGNLPMTGKVTISGKGGDMTIGYWYPILDMQYGVFVPTRIHASDPRISKGPLDPLRKTSVSMIDNSNWNSAVTTDRLIQMKRTLHIFTQLITWLFLNWANEHINQQSNCTMIVNYFINTYSTWEDQRVDSMQFYDFDRVPRRFPIFKSNRFARAMNYLNDLDTNLVIWDNGELKIQFYSSTFKDKIIHIIINECGYKKDYTNPGKWNIPSEIVDYYQNSSNFLHTHEYSLSFINTDYYLRYNQTLTNSPINNPDVQTLITNKLSEIYHPIPYIRIINDEEYPYLLQNTRSGTFIDALAVASVWFTEKRNIGHFPHRDKKIKDGYIDYYVYTNQIEGVQSMVAIDRSPNASIKPFVEIYKYNNQDRYAAMLPIFSSPPIEGNE